MIMKNEIITAILTQKKFPYPSKFIISPNYEYNPTAKNVLSVFIVAKLKRFAKDNFI